MEKKMESVAEVRSENGEVLWQIWMTPDLIGIIKTKTGIAEGVKSNGRKGDQGADGDSMTDAQKRYLFRLLAERGVEQEAAYDHIKKAFGVDNLMEISKFDASRAIDRLLNE